MSNAPDVEGGRVTAAFRSVPGWCGILVLALAPASALAATTTTVVDVPTRGVTQRFLYVRPDAPIANIVTIPGGPTVQSKAITRELFSAATTCN